MLLLFNLFSSRSQRTQSYYHQLINLKLPTPQKYPISCWKPFKPLTLNSSSVAGSGTVWRIVFHSYQCVGSKLLLAHLSQRLIGELIVYPCSGVRRRRRCAVVYHFQRSSPLKPLGQSKPNFMRSLLGKGERKFI